MLLSEILFLPFKDGSWNICDIFMLSFFDAKMEPPLIILLPRLCYCFYWVKLNSSWVPPSSSTLDSSEKLFYRTWLDFSRLMVSLASSISPRGVRSVKIAFRLLSRLAVVWEIYLVANWYRRSATLFMNWGDCRITFAWFCDGGLKSTSAEVCLVVNRMFL